MVQRLAGMVPTTAWMNPLLNDFMTESELQAMSAPPASGEDSSEAAQAAARRQEVGRNTVQSSMCCPAFLFYIVIHTVHALLCDTSDLPHAAAHCLPHVPLSGAACWVPLAAQAPQAAASLATDCPEEPGVMEDHGVVQHIASIQRIPLSLEEAASVQQPHSLSQEGTTQYQQQQQQQAPLQQQQLQQQQAPPPQQQQQLPPPPQLQAHQQGFLQSTGQQQQPAPREQAAPNIGATLAQLAASGILSAVACGSASTGLLQQQDGTSRAPGQQDVCLPPDSRSRQQQPSQPQPRQQQQQPPSHQRQAQQQQQQQPSHQQQAQHQQQPRPPPPPRRPYSQRPCRYFNTEKVTSHSCLCLLVNGIAEEFNLQRIRG